jgi:hypothetical protein
MDNLTVRDECNYSSGGGEGVCITVEVVMMVVRGGMNVDVVVNG